MRRPLLTATLALLAAVGLAAGCGDDGDTAETGDAPEETTTSTTTTAPEVDDDAAACVEAIREAAPAEAAESFPDNVEVEWSLVAVEEGGLGMQLAEMEPSSEDIGYPSFRFVFGCGDGEPELLAIYALDGEEYVLLSTTDAAEEGEFAPVLEE